MMDIFHSDSDCESFSESSGSEDQDEIDIYAGQAKGILSSLEESIGKIDAFLSFERGFIHGDIVCSVTDPLGQMGRVVDVDMIVDLKNVYGQIMKEVNCKDLLRIRSFAVGDYVIRGPWLGRVAKVVDRVTILFDDGTKYEVSTLNPENLLPVSPNLLEDSQYPYYPGQRVRVRCSSIYKSARWLCGAGKGSQDEGTVCGVEAGLVYVDWVATAIVGCNSSLPAPSCLQDSRDLTLLSCFSHAYWQLGDWCILPCQRAIRDQAFNTVTTRENEIFQGSTKRDSNSSLKEIYVIVKTVTKIDVLWQDGTRSYGLNSQSIVPVGSIGDQEFWPEQYVLEKITYDVPHISSCQRFGIVESVDAKERTVKVKWETLPVTQINDADGGYNMEIVSAYELIEHPDYSYGLGDVVSILERNSCIVKDNGQNESHADPFVKETGKDSVTTLGDGDLRSKTFEGDYLSYIGIVIGFKDGRVEVRWANDVTSMVQPCEIFSIYNYEDSTSASAVHEEDIEENMAQDMTEYDKHSPWKGKTSNDIGGDTKKYLWESSAFSLPSAAIGFFTNVAASLFRFRGSTSLGSMKSSHISENANKCGSLHEEDTSESLNLNIEEQPLISRDIETLKEISYSQKIKEAQENKELPYTSNRQRLGPFKKFDMVDDCSDHHFVDDASKGLVLSQLKRGWFKNVQREWSILERDLPDTIYVRVYEERIDLLRAAIVGAPGTPYHDGLFFFDFYLPPDYPNEPPLVHYNSGGLRVNPNLYESGKICLSLLKTWTGTGSEVWNPGRSTVLQVLLSLQALVLNEKPYFNEAGYDKQMGKAEGEKNSMSYNENAFLLSCKSMLFLLRNPPRHFEALVEEHFSRCAHSFLLACMAYMEGTPVGSPSGCESGGETQRNSSMGFKIMLAKLFPKLVAGFNNKGIDCSQFVGLQNELVGEG